MRIIGINRKIDKLGRIVLPKEMREFFRIEEGDEVEILCTDEGILLRKAGFKVVEADTTGFQ
ncbi:MAG: AbrB/MazE/SpoVT family DNA-binding domain-containing protein [Clostridia bacterium]|nr:AbrB/MazE/SpoVT family DNA-binding domain-containing protein [Clostridia bacterium]